MLLKIPRSYSRYYPLTGGRKTMSSAFRCNHQIAGPRHTRVSVTNGESWHWDQLFIATGAAARRCRCLMHWENAALPCAMPASRQTARSSAARTVSRDCRCRTIGLELAASATQRGCKVTVMNWRQASWAVMHHRPCNAIFSAPSAGWCAHSAQ